MGTTTELDAISQTLIKTLARAVPPAWADALEVDRRRDWVRLRADVVKLQKHNFQILCHEHYLELKTPKKRYRIEFKGFAPESEFSGRHLIFTFRSHSSAADRSDLGAELDRATWRVVNAAKGVKRVFVTRAINAVADLAEHNAEGLLEAATAASSDWEVLLRALSSTDVGAASSASDPLASARLRGIHARRQLLQAEGGAIQAPDVAEILGISRQAIDKRRQAGTLLALNVGGHGYRYPSWQFEHDGVLKGLERVLEVLSDHDEWMKLAFFVNANTHLGGESPLRFLRRGSLESVLKAAAAYGEHGAA